MYQVLLITLYHIWRDHKRKDETERERPTVRGAVNQSVSVVLKTDYLHLKTS